MFTFLDGVFRLFVPIIIVIFDLMVPRFGRKIQFLGSLVIEGILFGVVIALVATGTCTYDSRAVTILVIITTMINDCIFWINIVQITTQRYPTVIRCIAFGFLHSFRHAGAIIGFVILRPLLTSNWPTGAFVIPEAMIVITIIVGFFFQPETKGKALMDQMVEANYGRLENELPRALIRYPYHLSLLITDNLPDWPRVTKLLKWRCASSTEKLSRRRRLRSGRGRRWRVRGCSRETTSKVLSRTDNTDRTIIDMMCLFLCKYL